MINILLVEKDKQQLKFYADSLSRLGHSINPILAPSAEDALEIIKCNDIDGAIINIVLPGMDGFSLANKIRELDDYYFLPIVFEGGGENDIPETYKEYRNIDYIEKPFTIDEFLSAASHLIKEVGRHKILAKKKEEREITFLYDNGVTFITFSEILYISTMPERKICLVTRSNEYVRSNNNLRNVIVEINEKMFAQCHKSFAVNIENIKQIDKYSRKTWVVHFRNAPNKICYMSQKYKDFIDKLLYED